MKKILKKWFQKWWNIDCEVLEDPNGYSCTSWIIVKIIAITALLVWLFAFIKDYNIVFDRKDLIVSIFAIPCVAAFVYVYVQINKSIAERKVFTYRNARLLIRLSQIIGGGSVMIVPLAVISDHLWVVFLLLFNSMGAMALNSAGWMIHKGIKMQEEQDLTI